MLFFNTTLSVVPPLHSPFRPTEIPAEKSIFLSAGNLKEVVGM